MFSYNAIQSTTLSQLRCGCWRSGDLCNLRKLLRIAEMQVSWEYIIWNNKIISSISAMTQQLSKELMLKVDFCRILLLIILSMLYILLFNNPFYIWKFIWVFQVRQIIAVKVFLFWSNPANFSEYKALFNFIEIVQNPSYLFIK